MEQAQIQKLKINATNIKNSLTGYNNQLIKLRRDEFRFAFTEDKRKKLRKKEEKLESKTPIQKPLDVIKSKILSGPMSFFDKVKEFFGIVFLGLLINNLPKIINGLKKFFTENKWIIDAIKLTIKLLGDGIMGMIWLVTEYPKAVQKSMMNELKWAKKEFDKIIDIVDNAYKIWSNFYNPSPNSTQSSSPSTSQGSQAASQYQQPTSNTPSGSSSSPPQKFSRGGTVRKPSGSKPVEKQKTKSTITGTFRGATPTPMGKKAIESTNAFETFATVAEQVKEHSVLLDGKGGVNENFTDVNESFNQFLISLREREDKTPVSPGPGGSPPRGTPPGSTAPSIPGNGKISGGALVTQRNDPDGQDSGIDIALRDSSGGFGIGALIKNPFESLKITSTGFQGSGSGSRGKGFGLYVTGEAVVDGKRYELLVAHLDKVHVKRGDVISGGDSIGTQGISGHATGPHVSTHINALDGGNAQSILNAVEKSWVNGTLIKSQNMKPGKGAVNPIANNKASKISQSPEDSLMAMGGVDFFITQVIEKPVPLPMPMPVRVNSNSESSNNFIPEINPLLLV